MITLAQEHLPDHLPKADPLEILQEVVRNVLIRKIDKHWQEHLLHIDHLRTEVHLRAVGQKDPLLEFKHEAFALFDSFSLEIKSEIALALFKFAMMPPQKAPAQPVQEIKRVVPPPRFQIHLSELPELSEGAPS